MVLSPRLVGRWRNSQKWRSNVALKTYSSSSRQAMLLLCNSHWTKSSSALARSSTGNKLFFLSTTKSQSSSNKLKQTMRQSHTNAKEPMGKQRQRNDEGWMVNHLSWKRKDVRWWLLLHSKCSSFVVRWKRRKVRRTKQGHSVYDFSNSDMFILARVVAILPRLKWDAWIPSLHT